MSIPVLTIDGPSGAGKGTVSRLLAKQLGWNYLDSGSIYRSLAIAVTKAKINIASINEIITLAQSMLLEFECLDELVVRLEGIDITAKLSAESTGEIASKIATHPRIRTALLGKQQDFKQLPGLVADGRDMGTVVFPEAATKIFLTASVEKRGGRRYKQLIEKGINVTLEEVTKELAVRDYRDQERSVAPLKIAKDALCIDSSDLSVEQVIQEVLNWGSIEPLVGRLC